MTWLNWHKTLLSINLSQPLYKRTWRSKLKMYLSLCICLTSFDSLGPSSNCLCSNLSKTSTSPFLQIKRMQQSVPASWNRKHDLFMNNCTTTTERGGVGGGRRNPQKMVKVIIHKQTHNTYVHRFIGTYMHVYVYKANR